MKSLCAANSGEVLVSVACSTSLVLAPFTALNARFARSSSRPERSIAATVFSNVGGAFWLAIAVTSAFCCAIPASSAGRKSLSLMREKSGVWNGSVLGFANGLEAGKVADDIVEALRVAAAAGAVLTMPNAAVARRRLRIMTLPEQ